MFQPGTSRCIAWTKTWAERQKNQENEIPPLALRKHQASSRQDCKQEVKKLATKSDAKKPPLLAESLKRPKATIGQVAFLTLAQFDAIPKYMKGRVTYEGVNAAVEELNVALVEKYTFLGGKMADLPNPKAKKRYHSLLNGNMNKLLDQYPRYQALRAQESKDTKGVHFVTSEELRYIQFFFSLKLLPSRFFLHFCIIFRDSTHLKSETGRRSLLTILRS